ncbi:hypothetical protein [Actinotalea sp. K2]|uniref:hypothetical protein n=1 Tax=Actinotalea sp. K2 TaxID=2939438 RepID=UPI0020173899|nr:hypothetical protein [Actinotalea sp. K2]MCL3861750.1 hypothetical protein [Actinotalea sp. K2]
MLAAFQFHVFTTGARMRDLIGHHYYKLDAQIVHATIGQALERLRDACHALLTDLDADDHPAP